MKFAQLRAVFWMRARMLMNLIRRRGKVGNALFVLLALIILAIAGSGLVFSFALGMELLPDAKPMHLMIAWAVLTCGLLFSWSIGVMTELQRSDSISIHSLLHLPASMLGVHVYNYLGSFMSLSLLVFLPPMIGLASASVWVLGPRMLLLFPLIAGVVCLLNAVTYQLRGWLGTMMHDKRKRTNVIVLLTLVFVLMAQLPNMLNLSGGMGGFGGEDEDYVAREALPEVLESDSVEDSLSSNTADLGASGANELDLEALRAEDVRLWNERRDARKDAIRVQVDTWVTRATMAIPFGWLAFGARSFMEGNYLAGLLSLLGLFGLTAWSLRRSYYTTLRFVTGVGSASDAEAVVKVAKARGPLFVGRSLPFCSEVIAGIALAGIKSLVRAPESKMLLLTPVLLLMFGGVALVSGDGSGVPEAIRPFLPLAGIGMGLLTVMQLLQNQFGLERQGFRAFVLSPVTRHQLLIGKNLASAPISIAISLCVMIAIQFVYPVDLSHFVANWILLPAGYLFVCLAANLVAIVAPMKLKEGSMKAEHMEAKVVFFQIFSVLSLPILLFPIGLPSMLENLLIFLGMTRGLPVYLIVSVVVLLSSIGCYRFLIFKQGALLQRREQRILEVLTRTAF